MFSSMKSSKTKGGEELEDVSKKTTSKLLAWGDGSIKMSKSLGRDASRLYTTTASSSDDDDSSDSSSDEEDQVEDQKKEEKKSSESSKMKTKSLGRTDLYSASRRATNFVPVSERSAAYREKVLTSSFSQPSRTGTGIGTSTGARMRNHHSSSRIIEANPFFQQDRLGSDQLLKPSKSISTLDTVGRPKSSSIDSASSSSSATSPSRSGIPASGMSVQMRIKIWREKEELSMSGSQQQQQQLQNRKSLQHLTSTAVCAEDEEEKRKEEDRGAQSDDEVTKGTSGKFADGSGTSVGDRNNEILDVIVGSSMGGADSSSSSSLSSDTGDNGSGDGGAAGKGSSNKKVSDDAKGKRDGGKKKAESNKKRWNPLGLLMKSSNGRKQTSASSTSSKGSPSRGGVNKRPHTKSRTKSPSHLIKDVENPPSSADDVFSPVHHLNGTYSQLNGGIEEGGNEEGNSKTVSTEEAAKVALISKKRSTNEVKARPRIPRVVSEEDESKQKEGRSISSDIRSIINSLGSSEDRPLKELVSTSAILEDPSASGECSVPRVHMHSSFMEGSKVVWIV